MAARGKRATGDRVRRIGVLTSLSMDDPASQARLTTLQQGLQQLGWTEGRNIQIDWRWGAGNADNLRKYAVELAALAPDVIVANGTAAVTSLLQATRAVPIVFTDVPDPVGAGLVDTLARPGGNATGFMLFEYGMSGKWLELLKEIAPGVTRAAVLRDPSITAGVGQFAAIQSVAPLLGVELRPVDVRDAGEIERGVTTFARGSNGGLIVASSPSAAVHRDLIIGLAAGTGSLRCTRFATMPSAEGWSPTDPTRTIPSVAPRVTSIASSRARSQPTCRCRHPQSTN